MLRRYRIAAQIVSFTVFVVLVAGYWRFAHEGVVSHLAWFMRLEPFSTVVTSIAGRSVIIGAIAVAAGMIVLTAVFGRFFCGWLCPLGTMIDAVDSIIHAGKKKRALWRPTQSLQRLKYMILIGMLVLAAAGMVFPLFMDPMLIMVRFAALLGRPAALGVLSDLPGGIGKAYIEHPWVVNGAMSGALGAVILAFFVFMGAFLDKRFWCQYVCPSGAFMGLLSHFSIVRRIPTCGLAGGGCGICATVHCPTRAIRTSDYNHTIQAECILCGKCTADKRKCSHFGFAPSRITLGDKPDFSRRHLMVGAAAGAVLMPGLLPQASMRQLSTPQPVRPPGAVEEELFISRCIACLACVNACPSNALHPAPLSKGFRNWNTPELVGRLGYCLPECTRCSSACPTGALVPIRQSQKKSTIIGVAVVERGRCRSWVQEKTCRACYDKCPWDAIKLVTHTDEEGVEYESPVVNRVKCNGCGACEYVCPVLGEKAIVMYAVRRMPKRKMPVKKTT